MAVKMNHSIKQHDLLDVQRHHWTDGFRRFVSDFGCFMREWWYTRPWTALLACMPGLLLAGLYFTLLLFGQRLPTAKLADRYQTAAEAALQHNDVQAADVYYRRLAEFGDRMPTVQYGLARVRELHGDPVGARAMMEHLAPEDGAGYGKAHLWMTKEILREDGGMTPQSAGVIEHHLRQVLARDRHNVEATMLLGASLWARGDLARARPYLELTARHSPEWNLPLAVLYQMQQAPGSARRAAERAAAYFAEMAKANPQQPQFRLRWAESEMLMQNYAQAARVLRAGLATDNPEPFHDALVGVYLAWYDATLDTAPNGKVTRVELLNQALAHGPNDTRLLMLLADLTDRDDEPGQIARSVLQEALAEGAAPATVHLLLGTKALRKKDWKRAQMHLELAYQRAPLVPVVLNNLAWVLAEREPADLQRALELAKTARQMSDRPEFSFTLASILARLGQTRQAVAEFESVLRVSPHRADVHKELGNLYLQLGNPDLAEVFHTRAETLRQ